jgi:murein DD-endopeptidase MepM/ murein hydrolase activator NlpD
VTGLIRIVAICCSAALMWVVGASRVPSHEKLALSAIVAGSVMTQPFGCSSLVLEPFDPYCPSRHVHTGVDLAAPAGTSVHAASGGTVTVGFDPAGAGLYVEVAVDHHVRTLYCHLSEVDVGVAQSVVSGQVLGKVGSTGLSTGAHLHFEVQVDGRSVDPAVWLMS